MKICRATKTIFGIVVLCLLLSFSGCGVSQTSVNNNPVIPQVVTRADWGESLTTNGTGGVGQFPAKFTFDVTAAPDCVNDFIVYNNAANFTNLAPGPNIAAFNHLYSTQGTAGGLCNQDGPSVYWSYYTASATGEGFTPTSAVLSLDGSKVAFVETAGAASLQIVKWKAGQGTIAAPATPDVNITGTNWSTCPVGSSCIQSLTFSNGIQDTNSPPFVDYKNDVLYVGDDSGRLHKFTGVFNGTPTEVGGAWPIGLSGTDSPISGPVFDSVSGNIYVGDSSGKLDYVRDVGSTVGTCVTGAPPCVGATSLQVGGAGGNVIDTPIVDSVTQMVFAVNGTDTTNHGTILQASTDLITSVVSFNIGGTAAGSALYGGAFDNAYFGSSPGSITGHMYVCGKDNTKVYSPALYQLSFNSAGIVTGVGTPLTALVGASGEACSPVTEFFNTGTSVDWIFFSIGNNANTGAVGNPIPVGSPCHTGTASGAGCIISINLTALVGWPPALVSNTAPLPANSAGASSGIVVDNVSTSSQTSNIYFSLGTNSVGSGPGLPSCNTTAGVGCAVKLTQSGFN